jgi:class 3 adenylate cyclase
MGLSNRDVEVPDIDAFVRDLEAVMDRLELDKVVLWGSMFGGPVAVRYAARHPERVSKLILDTTWARPSDLQVSDDVARLTATMIELMRVSPEPALAYSSYLSDPVPEARHEDRVERARRSIAPDMLADLYLSIGEMDVESDAASVAAPTLVLHRRECSVPLAAGQRLASLIHGARFVGLDGRSTNIWEGDAQAPMSAIVNFLELSVPDFAPPEARGITVLLMTDLVESTAVTALLGDAGAEPLQRFHDDVVRVALGEHGGVETAHTGDGILARFSSAAAAVRCAQQIQQRFEGRNAEDDQSLYVRIGLNAGEPIGEGGEMFGAAVQKAARVCAAASPEEILVTPVVRALVEGKGFEFEDRGEHPLKGFADPVVLYAVKR